MQPFRVGAKETIRDEYAEECADQCTTDHVPEHLWGWLGKACASGGGTTPTLDQSTVITPVPSAIENPLALVAKRAAPRLERDETKDVANLGVERTK